ncbi:MAG: hypothetical protein DMG65_17155 [Candidatus Angelobacter sp. Gp1-AA117]|nr:MAG: hypothetical protein DMG65_17155 [Candidatus Angelobacter sp. Gp1-AA117]
MQQFQRVLQLRVSVLIFSAAAGWRVRLLLNRFRSCHLDLSLKICCCKINFCGRIVQARRPGPCQNINSLVALAQEFHLSAYSDPSWI